MHKLARTDTNWERNHLSANTVDGACRRMPWRDKQNQKNEGILCLVAHKGNMWMLEQRGLACVFHGRDFYCE